MSNFDWRLVKLGDLVDKANTGLDAIKRAPIVAYNSGIKCIRIQDISQKKAFEDWGFCEVTPENYQRFCLKKGYLIIARTGATIGVNIYIKEDLKSVYNNGLIRLKADKNKTFSKYLYYNLQSNRYKDFIESISRGTSAQPNMQIASLLDFKLFLPPLPEQKAIASILSSLDDKIELNQQMNQTLEAMARAIFKSWFVDFDPVRAKMAGNQPVGMDAATANLFPDSFKESELGLIPRGWTVKKLSDATSYLKRGIQPKYIDIGGVLVLNQRCVQDYRIDVNNARRHDTTKRSISDRELEIGDILVNSTGVGTLGRVAQVLTLEETAIVDSHVTIIRANRNYLTWNTLGLSIYNRQLEIEALGEGSTGQTELSKTQLGLLEIAIPPLSIQKYFDEKVLNLRKKTVLNDCESRTLANIRDTLLPKLMSGEK